jgi:hypothetical protein
MSERDKKLEISQHIALGGMGVLVALAAHRDTTDSQLHDLWLGWGQGNVQKLKNEFGMNSDEVFAQTIHLMELAKKASPQDYERFRVRMNKIIPGAFDW